MPESCQNLRPANLCAAPRSFGLAGSLTLANVVQWGVALSCTWGPRSLHTAEATGSKPVTPTSANTPPDPPLLGARQGHGRRERRGSRLGAARLSARDGVCIVACDRLPRWYESKGSWLLRDCGCVPPGVVDGASRGMELPVACSRLGTRGDQDIGLVRPSQIGSRLRPRRPVRCGPVC